MKYIGFTEKYYTLWDVTSKGNWTYYSYIKNVSMDFEKAKAKEPYALIDLSLRGHSSYKVKRDYIPTDCFQFGKYKGEFYNECTDYDYLCWYTNSNEDEAISKHTRQILLNNGYHEVRNLFVNEEDYKKLLRLESFEQYLYARKPFKFAPKYNLKTDGSIDIILAKINFPTFIEKEYNGKKYALPTNNGLEQKIKGAIVVVDDYTYTTINQIKYEINVNKYHIIYG